MKELREKYIQLLLEKCIYSNSKSLFISYDKSQVNFINDLVEKAKEKGFDKIILEEKDITFSHKLLKQLSVDEIKKHPYYLNDNWNKAIEEKCIFLLASTSFPNYFDDIEPEKLIASNQAVSITQQKYIEAVMNDSISWTIFGLPNKIWANSLFPNDKNSYEKLEKLIYSFCMIEDNNPVEIWDEYIALENKKTDFLNKINIKEIKIKNSLGTNLTIGVADNYIFRTLEERHCIENIPTYSIWTTPHKYIAEGIVYGSMPISYHEYKIEDYWFKFSEGKVIDYDAKIGKQYLDDYFGKGDSYKRLGEIAIIDFDSPISKTKMTYNNNLFDENVSTHLALGCAYQNTIKNGTSMDEKQLDNVGCNICSEHMDFTIGTEDLQITVKTLDGREIMIINNGNFDYSLINGFSPFHKKSK